MTRLHGILEPAFQDLRDWLADFAASNFQSAEALFPRLIAYFDTEPLNSLLAGSQRPIDFDSWWEATKATAGGMLGSGVLRWPTDRAQRVALQVELCRRLASGDIRFLAFTHEFTNPHPSRSTTEHAQRFRAVVLEPLVRDVMRLTEERPLPPILFDSMGALPRTGDHILDSLIADACAAFRDSAPTAARTAVEKLWDAWERLKSVRIPDDKRASISAMLDSAAGSAPMRGVLEDEATMLTKIGNTFRIRHSEVGKHEIGGAEGAEYLFHRLYALIHLLLHSERRRHPVAD